MNVETESILALPVAEKLKLVELLWDDIGQSQNEIPLPEWLNREASRRRDEMVADPELGHCHEETWSKIAKRNG